MSSGGPVSAVLPAGDAGIITLDQLHEKAVNSKGTSQTGRMKLGGQEREVEMVTKGRFFGLFPSTKVIIRPIKEGKVEESSAMEFQYAKGKMLLKKGQDESEGLDMRASALLDTFRSAIGKLTEASGVLKQVIIKSEIKDIRKQLDELKEQPELKDTTCLLQLKRLEIELEIARYDYGNDNSNRSEYCRVARSVWFNYVSDPNIDSEGVVTSDVNSPRNDPHYPGRKLLTLKETGMVSEIPVGTPFEF
jgi:hypothetical protein